MLLKLTLNCILKYKSYIFLNIQQDIGFGSNFELIYYLWQSKKRRCDEDWI